MTQNADANKRSKGREPNVIIVGNSVRVWAEVGATLPIGDTTAHLRFTFGHERIAKSSSQEEIRKTAALIDEFNERELERRIKAYKRLIRSVTEDEDDEDEDESIRSRARKRLRR